jgi:hypothetical protein
MKKILPLVFLAFVFTVGMASACFSPTDSFASEVVLNKPGITYNLQELRNSPNVTISDGNTVYRSHFDPRVAVVIREVKEDYLEGLSVKVQIPTQTVFISESVYEIRLNKTMEIASLDVHDAEDLGWNVSETRGERISYSIKKADVNINIQQIKDKTHVLVEIIDVSTISQSTRDKIGDVLVAIGFVDYPSQAFSSSIESSKINEWTDLEPAVEIYPSKFSFGEAMKTELLWLEENKVISGLEDTDLENISQVCKRGTAGNNSRVVWEKEEWLVYSETENPLLLRDSGGGCLGLPQGILPSGVLHQIEVTQSSAPTWWPLLSAIVIILFIGSYAIYRRYYF